MPLYFFDVRDAQGLHADETGLELPDMDTAIAEGRRALADMNREALLRQGSQDIQILIRDHDEGPILLELSVTARKVLEDE